MFGANDVDWMAVHAWVRKLSMSMMFFKKEGYFLSIAALDLILSLGSKWG